VITLTAARTRQARVRANGLAGDRAASVAEATRRAVGLQAQDVKACRLSVRSRTSGLVKSDVDKAVRERAVVRTWAMRGTLHMVAAEDLGWVVGLLGPYFAKGLFGRRRQLGLDEETTERGVRAVAAVLSGSRPLTRAELVARIAEHGVVIDPRTQAVPHLLGYAAMTGVICRGPGLERDEPSYVLTREWLGEQPVIAEEEALTRLAARYLAGYGPAAAEDFAAWSGLPLGKARQGFGGLELEPVTAAGEPAFVLAGTELPATARKPEVRLLGHFDAYLLGYRGRALAVPDGFEHRIRAGGGMIMPAVLVDGLAVGTWRQVRRKDGLRVIFEPFGAVADRVLPGLQDEVTDLGRFVDLPTEWEFGR
jgi:hypothetical protein